MTGAVREPGAGDASGSDRGGRRGAPAVELSHELVAAGEALVRALDESGVSPDTAFWMWFRDVEGWRLVLSGGGLARSAPRSATARVRALVGRTSGMDALEPAWVGVAAPEAASVSAIRAGLATGPGFHGIRLRNNTVRGVVIPAAYVYRAN